MKYKKYRVSPSNSEQESNREAAVSIEQNIGTNNGLNIGVNQGPINMNPIIQTPDLPNTDVVKYQYIKAIPLNMTVNMFQFLNVIAAVIGFWSSVITVKNEYGLGISTPILSLILIIVAIICSTLFVTSIFVKKKGFQRIGYGKIGINFELSDDRQIYITKVAAQCPSCPGIIRLWSSPNNMEWIEGRCDRNPHQHSFSFDHTTFQGQLLQRINFY